MKSLFTCELEYFPSSHLSQLYDGFEKLKKVGLIDLSMKAKPGDSSKPLLTVIVNNKHRVVYDTLDGLNWIDGSIEDNLDYFKNKIKADFYFKRSYDQQVFDHAPANCKVYPLGLSLTYKPAGIFPKSLTEIARDLLRDNWITSKYYNRYSFSSRDFEYYPIPVEENKILFLAGLWNPDDVSSGHLKTERERINKSRTECIRICQKEFGPQFLGGLQDSSFSRQYAKDLILPSSLTKRANFLNAIKEHTICIATTGLHNSTGWKFGEYVAASRAIISEPLHYELPGDFENGKNYFSYSSGSELVGNIQVLLENKNVMYEMMKRNFHYYNTYLRSDVLVLNTLLKIEETTKE